MEDLTSNIFLNVCRGLFEKDKLLFAFMVATQVCARVACRALWQPPTRAAADRAAQEQRCRRPRARSRVGLPASRPARARGRHGRQASAVDAAQHGTAAAGAGDAAALPQGVVGPGRPAGRGGGVARAPHRGGPYRAAGRRKEPVLGAAERLPGEGSMASRRLWSAERLRHALRTRSACW